MTTLGALVLTSTSYAQFSPRGAGILLGGGYLEEPEDAYFFGQLRGTVYEDQAVAHTFFLEFLGHQDDAEIEFFDFNGSSFTEDGDLNFANFTVNYELEAKLGGPVSFYVGGGVGVEYVSLDDRFDFSIDDDTNFVGQVFAGLRFKTQRGLSAQLGARYIFRQDFDILGDEFIAEDTFGFEASVGFRF